MKALNILLLLISIRCSGQSTIKAEFTSRDELILSNTSNYTLKVIVREGGGNTFYEYITPNSKKSINGSFRKRVIKNSYLYFTYDQIAYETDLLIVKRQTEYAIRQRQIEKENATFWKMADQFFTGGKISRMLNFRDYVIKAGKGDWIGIAQGILKDKAEDELVKRASENSNGITKKAIESLVVGGVALMERADEGGFPVLEQRAKQCIVKFRNEGFLMLGGENLWQIASNTSVFKPQTPLVMIDFMNLDVQMEEDINAAHSYMGATEKFNYSASLSLPITPEHRLGSDIYARLYAVGTYETQSLKIQTNYLLGIQKKGDIDYKTVYAIQNQNQSNFENKMIVNNVFFGIGGRYTMFFSNAFAFSLEGGFMRNMNNTLELSSATVLERNNTGTLVLSNNTDNLNDITVFQKNTYMPYAKYSIGMVFKQNSRFLFSPFFDMGFFWKSPTLNNDFRIAELARTTTNLVTPKPIPSVEAYTTINLGLKFGF
jgi:hypothetical protein